MNKYSRQPGDSILALLEPGEYVLNRNAVNEIGKENLDELTDSPNWKRNQQMIDFNYIPDEIRDMIINEFEKEPTGSRNNILNYFIDNRLKNLMQHIEEF